VLIGATAIPVWSQNRIVIPPHLLTSGLGCSSGILELAGFLTPATQLIGLNTSAIETVIAIIVETPKRRVDAPLHKGRAGTALRIAGFLEGTRCSSSSRIARIKSIRTIRGGRLLSHWRSP